jgi:hypothetical protein
MVKSETRRAPGMVQGHRPDDRPVRELQVVSCLEPVMLHRTWQLRQRDRKQGWREQTLERFLGRTAAQIAEMKAYHPVRHQRWPKERQADNVVEMEVAQKNVDLSRRAGSREFRAELHKAGARIDDEQPRAAPNLDTRRVAAEFLVLEAGYRQ